MMPSGCLIQAQLTEIKLNWTSSKVNNLQLGQSCLIFAETCAIFSLMII